VSCSVLASIIITKTLAKRYFGTMDGIVRATYDLDTDMANVMEYLNKVNKGEGQK
jgi:hypothetical protein